MRGYKKRDVRIDKDEQKIELECNYDAFQANATAIRIRLNNTEILEYANYPANSTNYNCSSNYYSYIKMINDQRTMLYYFFADVPEWLLNDRVSIQKKNSSLAMVINDIDSDLNGRYNCEVMYQYYGSTGYYTIKSNGITIRVV